MTTQPRTETTLFRQYAHQRGECPVCHETMYDYTPEHAAVREYADDIRAFELVCPRCLPPTPPIEGAAHV